ncbi:MAG: hypothetical protein IAF38_01925 [Bacteroidia bacterium]|nr:hypothetical protein [Bacteroidia bacterium]
MIPTLVAPWNHVNKNGLNLPEIINHMEQTLLKNGWQKQEANPFKEKIVEKAVACFTFENSNNTGIGFFTSEDPSRMYIRLYKPDNSKFNYFEIKTDTVGKSIEKLISLQHSTNIDDYFSFYLDMQQACEISILAWEQWETNYK